MFLFVASWSQVITGFFSRSHQQQSEVSILILQNFAQAEHSSNLILCVLMYKAWKT